MNELFKLISFLSLILFYSNAISQVNSCYNANPFCSNTAYTYISDSTATADTIHNYACLATQPGIHWNQMFVTTQGSMTLSYSTQSSSSSDIDYAAYAQRQFNEKLQIIN